jgi:hypothetical protein
MKPMIRSKSPAVLAPDSAGDVFHNFYKFA